MFKDDRLAYNQRCTDVDRCDDLKGFSCINGSCVCEEDKFFNRFLCGKLNLKLIVKITKII